MKYVRKITPVSLYDVRGLESWLEDMARRGLFLKKFRPLFCTFQRGPARTLRYRVEPCQEVPPQAMLDLYQDFGWDFSCETAELLIFSTEDETAPEPHSDPELQGQLWRKLYRSKRRGLWISLALDLVVAVCAWITLFRDRTPILNLLITSVLWSFAVLAVLLYYVPQNWVDVNRLALIVQQLEAGVPLDHRSVYPRRRWSQVFYTALAVLLLVLLIISQWVLPFTGGGVRPLEELTAFTPLSLAEVEGEGYQPHTFVMNGRNYGNFCALEHYLLCPERWEVVQSGDVGLDDRVRMEIYRYDLPDWLSGLAVPLARELLEDSLDLDHPIWGLGVQPLWSVDYYRREDTGFLAVARHRDGLSHRAAAAVGDKVVLVTYVGSADLAEHLKAILDMVQ